MLGNRKIASLPAALTATTVSGACSPWRDVLQPRFVPR
jgi:hypothetical protein